MTILDRLFKTYATVSEEDVARLEAGSINHYTVEVRPPRNTGRSGTLTQFVRGIRELQSKWFGLVNKSPIGVYELRRESPGQLRFQYSVPTKRLERKLRTQLQNQVPGVEFAKGSNGLPVSPGDAVGGGVLTLGRSDCYPLRTDFDNPPINALTSALHRHAMQDTRVVIQVLFQPVTGEPLHQWWWTRNAYKRIGYLRKEKPGVFPWHDRSATPRERGQADAIEGKAGTSNFHVSIRFLVIGTREHIESRVKEIAGGFNVFENPETGQYFDTVTVKNLRESKILEFAETVAKRRFEATPRFRLSTEELAALVSLPSQHQENIRYAQP